MLRTFKSQALSKFGIYNIVLLTMGFPGGSVVKNLSTNSGDAGLIPGLGRSPGEGNGNPVFMSGKSHG